MKTALNRRILLIDDMPSIHEDFRKILIGPTAESDLDELEEALFGAEPATASVSFDLDSAYQGQEGLERVCLALQADRPYAMAFVDMRMPPGWDGLETIRHLWQHDPRLQIVICTAYSDHSWDEVFAQLDVGDRLLILKKPFDNVEVLQLASALTAKWQTTQEAALKLSGLEKVVQERTAQLQSRQDELEQANLSLSQAVTRLEELAMTDGLTGLKNHRAFQDRLREEYDRSVRYQRPMSIILLDVDNFKHYNDTYGHPAGDQILIQLSSILQQELRLADIVARYGGEEFVVIAPETAAEGARLLAERIRQAIASASWPNEAVTASFGVSTLTLLTPTAAILVAEADEALYRSKHQGRNRVTHSADATEEDAPALQACADITQTILQGHRAFLLSAADQMREMLVQSFNSTIVSWSRLLDLRDKETEGHSERVTILMARVMQHLGMNEEEVMFARWGALLHDIGKIAIPEEILHKPGSLTDEEWVIMRSHTTIAYEMLRPIKFLGSAVDIPYCHHEKWDGSGYPRGLQGDEIPLTARLFAVIDVYDALRSDRPYRRGWEVDKVLAYLKEQSGTHFEPRAVEILLQLLGRDECIDKPVNLLSPNRVPTLEESK